MGGLTCTGLVGVTTTEGDVRAVPPTSKVARGVTYLTSCRDLLPGPDTLSRLSRDVPLSVDLVQKRFSSRPRPP